MNLLRKNFTFVVLFLTSSALFLGGMLFLTKKNSLYIPYTKQTGISNMATISFQKWGADFYEKNGILLIKNIKDNHYAKSIGLKNGDKIIKINSLYLPSKKEIINYIKKIDNSKIINIVVKRGENLYNFKALPSF